MSESERNETLDKEYDATFTDDERITNMLKLTSDAFTREYRTIKISEIGITDPVKQGRKATLMGLSGTVKEMGVLQPIHVMTVEKEVEDDDYKYILLDGLRRIFAARRNGNEEIDAIVWDFKDKDYGIDNALTISCLLNNNKRRKWEEIWNLYQVLELQKSVSPGTIETLLQLEAGDAMKLKDVMLSDYPEVKGALMDGTKDLEGCYKMLAKLRKEEDSITKEDEQGISDLVEDTEELINQEKEKPMLSEEDTKELLDLADNLDDNLDNIEDEDFDDLNDGVVDSQAGGERHPLDPALKSAILSRDNFRCKCCGFGGPAALGVLAVHHILPVHTFKKGQPTDYEENLTTLCLNHHILLHVAERNGGKLHMTREEFESYSEEEQTALKKCLKLAKIAVAADKKRNMSLDDVKKATKDSIRHPMPGTNLKETESAYSKYKTTHEEHDEKEDEEDVTDTTSEEE